jgi:hypothetical protein
MKNAEKYEKVLVNVETTICKITDHKDNLDNGPLATTAEIRKLRTIGKLLDCVELLMDEVTAEIIGE